MDPIVEVVVGGHIFMTRKTTLERESTFFASLFSGNFGDTGPVVLDRTPELFGEVLHFLRTHVVATSSLDALYEEAMYFGVNKLIEEIDFIKNKQIKECANCGVNYSPDANDRNECFHRKYLGSKCMSCRRVGCTRDECLVRTNHTEKIYKCRICKKGYKIHENNPQACVSRSYNNGACVTCGHTFCVNFYCMRAGWHIPEN